MTSAPAPFPSAFRAGAAASLPLAMAVIPFGIVCGASAADIGLGFQQAFALSWLVFAGSSQVVAVHLLGSGAPVWVIVLTGWLVNLRFLMYSAALAPAFRGENAAVRSLCAYTLTDQSFATTLSCLAQGRPPRECARFCLGLSLAIWLQWQLASITGILLGSLVPPGLGIDFIVALTFIALIVPLLDRPLMRVAAVVGGAVALLPPLPFRLNLMAAALAGAAVALLLERKWKTATSGR